MIGFLKFIQECIFRYAVWLETQAESIDKKIERLAEDQKRAFERRVTVLRAAQARMLRDAQDIRAAYLIWDEYRGDKT